MTTVTRLIWPVFVAGLLLAATGCASSPQAREVKFLKRGEALMAKHEYSRAILEFSNAAQAIPRDAEPQYRLGLAYIQVRDLASAAKSLNRATQLNPAHAGAALKLAEIMAASGDKEMVKGASSRIEQLLAAAPDNVEAIDTLAAAEFRLGNAEDAEKRLNEELVKFPGRLESAMILARIKIGEHKLASAESVLKKARAALPQSAAAALALGQLYQISKQPEKAEPEIDAALQLEPQNPAALMALGEIQLAAKRMSDADHTYQRLAALPNKTFHPVHAVFLFQTGQKEAGLAELQQLARRDPGDRTLRSRLVSFYLQMGKTREAQDVLTSALRKNVHDSDALLQRGEVYLKSGKPVEADADLKEVLRQRPDSAEAHMVMAGVFRAQGNRNQDMQELDTALRLKPSLLAARITLANNFILAKQPQAAIDLIDRAPQPQKSAAGLVIARNWALLASGNTAEAERQLTRYLSAKRVPELVFQEAVLKMNRHDYPGARLDAEESLSANPDDVRAASIIADAYIAQGNRAKALERLTQIATQRPRSARFQYLLGECYKGAERMDDARKTFEAAKTADAHFYPAGIALADLDHLQNRTGEERKQLEAVIAVDSKNVPALLRLAELEDAGGNRKAAAVRYRAVLDLDGSDIYALNNLAYDLALENPDEALKLARRAGEIAPDNPSVQDTLAWIYHRKGSEQTAITYLKTAVAKDPTPRHQFHLAMCYLKAGEQELGHKTMVAALAKEPNLGKMEAGW